MEKLFKILIIICILIFSIPYISAYEEKRGIIISSNNDGINIRSGPGISHSVVTSLPDGGLVTIIGEEVAQDGCSDVWYKIIYNNLNSYACSTFITIIEGGSGEVSSEFPDDYKLLLDELQKTYPNAIFKPVSATNKDYTAMTFEYALYNQTLTYNKNLVWDSNGSRDGWKNIETYIYESNSFRNDFSGGGTNWYSPTEEIIAYYMDPRNFFNEESIFMFESLGYDASVHTLEGVESILKGTYMETEKVDGGEKSFAEVIMEAGKKHNVSPYFLASRIRLEVGSGRSALVQGTYSDYPQFNGYYNYYNIGAGGDNVIYNGLKYAYDSGWNSEYNAIVNGALWIKNNYVASDESTAYFQKWDVACGGTSYCFSQYMQNIQAPETEAKATYNAYFDILGAELYNTPFIFYIPVFADMPEETEKPSTASGINYLESLIVNDNLINNFHGLTYKYSITVPYNTTSINIQTKTKDDQAKVIGNGDIEVDVGTQTLNITVTAENGSILTYNLEVTRLDKDENLMTLEETLNALKSVKINDNYMSGVTSVDVIKESFNTANPNALVTVKRGNTVLNSGDIKTNDTVTVEVEGETVSYSYVLYGDNNGDGLIDIVDLLLVQKHLLKVSTLSKAFNEASDVNRDGVIDIVDLLLVQKHLLGATHINQ